MGGGQDVELDRADKRQIGLDFDALNERNVALTNALRKLAIVPKQKRGVQNRVEYDGFRCRCCSAAWLNAGPEIHFTDCPLDGSQL